MGMGFAFTHIHATTTTTTIMIPRYMIPQNNRCACVLRSW